jgi:tetratricopeptide (TPR) repeat protein
MNNHLPPKFIITVIAISSFFCFAGPVFAKASQADYSVDDVAGAKRQQAEKYRELGIESQRIGNLADALGFYQKAVAIYPGYAVAYNDIGVVYEAMGNTDKAEESYLKSAEINPDYPSVYTNLALLYEGRRNLKKAEYYWAKRAEIGAQDDPWRQKAASRLRDIQMSLSDRPFTDEREAEVLDLMQDFANNKSEFEQKNESLAQTHFKKAKLNFSRGNLATAIKEALDAEYLDPNNPEIVAFIEKVELRALTR